MGFKATSQLKVQLEERPVEETFRGFYSRLALDRLPYESASVFERLTGYELPGE